MIPGYLEAKLIWGAVFGGMLFLALASFVLLPAGIIALMNRSEQNAMDRLRREGTRCQVFVKSYRRVSMTQHRVLFDLHLPGGRVGREYMISGLSEADLANWAALQIPLTACAHADATTIALDGVAPITAGPSLFPKIMAAVVAASLLFGAFGALLHSDQEKSLYPELRAMCTALRDRDVDVANVQITRQYSKETIAQIARVDLDDDPYSMFLYKRSPTDKPAPHCMRKGLVELCARSSGKAGQSNAMSRRVRNAFAAYAK